MAPPSGRRPPRRGWETLADDGERVVLRKRGFGRIPVHVVLFLLTGGIGNLLYALYRYSSGAPRREVYADGTERSLSGGDGGPGLGTVLATLAGGGLLFVGLVWFAAALIADASLLATVLGALVFVLSALAVVSLPRVARDGVKSPGTFGTERTVERERVRNPSEPCAACGRRVFHGEHRRYAERLYVAGLPVRTASSGENVYCAACADETAGPFDDDEIDAELARMRAERGARGDARRDRSTAGASEREPEVESDPR
ncbi:hypothetical protein [Halobaculum litoreum]|uniref:Zinc ribbon domain-containing protein n=1 Tax=Halobaculum litoreum TaxID=3031998 RepID=A0ABD5XPQ9_9EURY|nr:hypothetical protein [Halobaculum sp. DT92]